MKKLIILPKLNDCGGSTKKQWFIYYSVRDPRTDKMVRFRHYEGFTGLKAEDKYSHAARLIEDFTQKLRSGWSPFTDSHGIVIYKDHIDYQSESQIFDKKRAGNRTLRVIISQFLDYKQAEISKATYQTYSSKLRIFTLWTEKLGIEQNDIQSYSNSLIISFFNFLIDERKLSRVSIRKYTELLKILFQYCVDKRYLKKNPIYGIPRCSRINDQAPRPIMRQDIEIFVKELMKDPELWLVIQFEYYCALRPGHEIRELKLQDIDLVAGILYITRGTAKNRTQAIITMPRQLLTYLRSLSLQQYDRSFYLFGNTGKPGSVSRGKNYWYNHFAEIRKKLNMPREYTLYSWKHTAAVELDTAKIPLSDISRHYRHANLAVTATYMRNKQGGTSEAIRNNFPDLVTKI